MKNTLEQAAAFLRDNDDFLLLTHEKPDGDAVGSLLGLREMLRAAGKRATAAAMPDSMPEKYSSLLQSVPCSVAMSEAEAANFNNIVVLDCSRFDRIAAPFGRELIRDKNICCIDHHPDNDIECSLRFVDGTSAATGEILAALPLPITPEAASLLYLALVTDTGGFRFSNTKAATLETGAKLLRAGADHEKIINAAFFSKKANQQMLESRMVMDCEHSEFDGRYRWAYIPEGLFREYDFDMRDGESVIELLRELGEVVICALIYPRDGALKVSLRSKDSRFSVGAIARKFGGGGHEMAAGITVKDMTLEELAHKLSTEIGKYF